MNERDIQMNKLVIWGRMGEIINKIDNNRPISEMGNAYIIYKNSIKGPTV